jgi:hypothetical protein
MPIEPGRITYFDAHTCMAHIAGALEHAPGIPGPELQFGKPSLHLFRSIALAAVPISDGRRKILSACRHKTL